METKIFTKVVFLLLLLGCSPPLRIRPEKIVSTPVADTSRFSLAAVRVDEDDALDALDFNPYLIGLLPLRVTIHNPTPTAQRPQLFFTTTKGQSLRALHPDKVYSRVLKAYDVTAYPVVLGKESKNNFTALCLDLSSPIPPQSSRTGLVFFPVGLEGGAVELKGADRIEVNP
ncbi:MAG: hypothetical protein QW828_08085 [Candidatus Bathyarchaeia archaeon]